MYVGSWVKILGESFGMLHIDFVSFMSNLSSIMASRTTKGIAENAYPMLGRMIVLRILFVCCSEVGERSRAMLLYFILVVVMSF